MYCGWGWLREYFRVRATQVVRVKYGCVVEVLLLDSAKGQGEGIGCGGFGKELWGKFSDGFGDRRFARDHYLRRLSTLGCIRGQQSVAGYESFAKADSINVDSGVKLTAAGVEQGLNADAARRLSEMREDGEA